jgi:hypothetical protein
MSDTTEQRRSNADDSPGILYGYRTPLDQGRQNIVGLDLLDHKEIGSATLYSPSELDMADIYVRSNFFCT